MPVTVAAGSTTDVVAADLTVVVVALNAPDLLPRCLEALEALADSGLEVCVVRHWGPAGEPEAILASRFPQVRWLSAPVDTTVPVMRSIGIGAATGRLVALLEDDCLVQPGWADAVRRAHAGPAAAVGGAVEPGEYRHGRDWGVYFCEYGRFMPPVPETDTTDLAGMNVAYKRDELAGHESDPDGFRDVFVHWAWASQGRTLRSSTTFVVRNVNSWRGRHVTSLPYHHGRAFAGARFAGAGLGRRLAFATAAAVVLPGLKTVRLAAIVAGRRRHIGRFVVALPWVVLFNTAWTCGEVVGSVLGPGTSAAQWR